MIWDKGKKRQEKLLMENIFRAKFKIIFVMDVQMDRESVFIEDIFNVFINFPEKEFNLISIKEYRNL